MLWLERLIGMGTAIWMPTMMMPSGHTPSESSTSIGLGIDRT